MKLYEAYGTYEVETVALNVLAAWLRGDMWLPAATVAVTATMEEYERALRVMSYEQDYDYDELKAQFTFVEAATQTTEG
jgi:hypothetical protein